MHLPITRRFEDGMPMTPTRPFPASIEVLPRRFKTTGCLLFPRGTQVYLTDIGTPETEAEMLAAAQELSALGHQPVPHIAARRIASEDVLERRVSALAEDAGVSSMLLIGGGLDKPSGPFDSVMAMLETGVFQKNGISELAIAGHPEGSPDFSDATADAALLEKQEFAARHGIRLRIVTQFAFDAQAVLDWVAHIREIGVDIPVHVGVAGPAGLLTLIKYAKMCGIGKSASLLARQPKRMMGLGSGYAPDTIIAPVEEAVADGRQNGIIQIHVFPFGGLESSAAWLRARSSWETQPIDGV